MYTITSEEVANLQDIKTKVKIIRTLAQVQSIHATVLSTCMCMTIVVMPLAKSTLELLNVLLP